MNEAAIKDFEDLLFACKRPPGAAANHMADILGVLIGVKPVAFLGFSETEFAKLDTEAFNKLLSELGLSVVEYEHRVGDAGASYSRFVSKMASLASELCENFKVIWALSDKNGRSGSAAWKKSTRAIGRLLGYPETATDYFISHGDVNDPDRKARAARNRYYIHSPDAEEDEYRAYDQPINRAISEFAPRTTAVMTENKAKRWLD